MKSWWQIFRKRDDLAEEIEAHLAMAERDHIDSGHSPETARSAVRREFGNLTLVKEVTSEQWGRTGLERFSKDISYALRLMRRNPVFTAVAVFSLALGISANASIFTLFDAVLLKSLPVSRPEQLRILTWVTQGSDPVGMTDHSGYSMTDDGGRNVDGSFSYPAYETFRKSVPQFSALVAFAPDEFTVTANRTTDFAFGNYVSGNFFTGLGVLPRLGRTIVSADDDASKPPVAVLTDLFWKKRFGSDPSVLGRVITVDHLPVTVIGVLPASFQGLSPGRDVDLFVPMSVVPSTALYYSLSDPNTWWVQIFGRLKPSGSGAAAAAALQSALLHHVESYAGSKAKGLRPLGIVLEPGNRGVGLLRGGLGTPLCLLIATAGLLLLIACLNLATLLLARNVSRTREISIRVAIGASRRRLIRQMLTESLLLAAAGAATGLILTKPLIALLIHFFFGDSTLGLDPRIDIRTLIFTAALCVMTTLLFGTLPSWRATRASLESGLKVASTLSGGRFVLGRYLVSLEVALSLVLLAGTGLFLRTLWTLTAVDLGFDTSHLLTFQTDPARSGDKSADIPALYDQLEAHLRAIPGVVAVGMSHQALMAGYISTAPVRLSGLHSPDKASWLMFCSDSFLPSVKIPIVMGRNITRAEFEKGLRTAVVNQTFAKRYLPKVDPIGKDFYMNNWDTEKEDPRPITIVGVAKDAHYEGIRNQVPPTIYLPYGLRARIITGMTFVLRTRVAPGSVAPAVRRAVADVDPTLPVAEMRTEREQIDRSLQSERLFAVVITSFGIIAVVLTAVGLYGVVAFSVSRRTSELGLRMALGAARRDVEWIVLRQSLAIAALGLCLGLPAVLALTKLAKTLLYGVTPNDPLSITAGVVAMLAVTSFAAWHPARRAASIDPVAALRSE